MNESNKNECHALKFWPNNKSLEEVCKDVTVDEKINQVFTTEVRINPRDLYLSSDSFEEVEKHQLVNLIINHIETGTTVLEEAYMPEIQLRKILDRTGSDMEDQQPDGDERMTKGGEDISKFSKEAMTLGDDVYDFNDHAPIIKVYLLYDKYVGEDRVFPTKNGAPRIMTKYKDIPYTYELQHEYAGGKKKFPCATGKAMDWTGKTASAQVIRGFWEARQ